MYLEHESYENMNVDHPTLFSLAHTEADGRIRSDFGARSGYCGGADRGKCRTFSSQVMTNRYQAYSGWISVLTPCATIAASPYESDGHCAESCGTASLQPPCTKIHDTFGRRAIPLYYKRRHLTYTITKQRARKLRAKLYMDRLLATCRTKLSLHS